MLCSIKVGWHSKSHSNLTCSETQHSLRACPSCSVRSLFVAKKGTGTIICHRSSLNEKAVDLSTGNRESGKESEVLAPDHSCRELDCSMTICVLGYETIMWKGLPLQWLADYGSFPILTIVQHLPAYRTKIIGRRPMH